MLPFPSNNPAASCMVLCKKNPKPKQNKSNSFISTTFNSWLQSASEVCAHSQTIAAISTMLLDEFG